MNFNIYTFFIQIRKKIFVKHLSKAYDKPKKNKIISVAMSKKGREFYYHGFTHLHR